VTGCVVSVNAGRVVDAQWAGRLRRTAIDKRPVDGAVAVDVLGLAGDDQADTEHHGGADKAVYAYADEDAHFWEGELGRPLWPGAFGENLTTSGVDLTGAVIGERWRVGTALLEVRWPRIPCRVFAGFWDVPDLVKRFTVVARPGAYLGVLEAGHVAAGNSVDVVHRPAHGVTIGEVFRARSGERALVPRILQAAELPAEARAWATGVLAD
jgi:MOSC domain-containing protein YiiM